MPNNYHDIESLITFVQIFDEIKIMDEIPISNQITYHYYAKKEINQLLSDDWKFAAYFLGDDVALRLFLSSDMTEKIKNRMKLILEFTKPEFPICGDDLIKLGFRQGVDLGKVLKKLEIKWVKSNFLIDKDQLLTAINN